uniref:Uncharacterized protein n=1 Tax=Candidatus Kentrum sp. TC TaxID=2126339 RepID=A0A450Z4E3_9GAMM|nr:MAG: hypothetical protein BECKTC1821E_GA0114239_11238 [Candidatus Kentron sp. TC]
MKSNENPIPDDRIDNPFEYTRPLVNKGKLVPRNDTVRDITNALRRESVVSVMGSWQTGKTGMLRMSISIRRVMMNSVRCYRTYSTVSEDRDRVRLAMSRSAVMILAHW